MTQEELNELSKLPYYKERMERLEMKKAFTKANNGVSSFEPSQFPKYIDWLENRLFEANKEIERLRLYDVIGSDFSIAADMNLELKGTIDFSKQKIAFEKIIAKAKLK
jgi:hypothetical protein